MSTHTAAQRYQLREAGGAFWLLDMEQPGFPYRAPLQINEVGADIWRYFICQGLSVKETATQMSAEYGVDAEVIVPDIEDFLNMLKAHRIDTEDGEKGES